MNAERNFHRSGLEEAIEQLNHARSDLVAWRRTMIRAAWDYLYTHKESSYEVRQNDKKAYYESVKSQEKLVESLIAPLKVRMGMAVSNKKVEDEVKKTITEFCQFQNIPIGFGMKIVTHHMERAVKIQEYLRKT